MRSFVLSFLGLLILLGTVTSIARVPAEKTAPADAARDQRRWLPDACVLVLGLEHVSPTVGDSSEDRAEARWNHFYRLGIEAIQSEDLEAAEISFCHALTAAGSFEEHDIRFAETLDELGLVNYLKGDDEGAEAIQGAAVAEMLLAVGPPTEDLAETAEKSCRSSVATYMVRLGWIFDRQGRGQELESLLREPYRILARGYVPQEAVLARLDGLIAQYLLNEDFAAADWLTALREPDSFTSR